MSPLLGLKMDFQKILQFSHLMQHPFKNKKNKDDGEPEVRKKIFNIQIFTCRVLTSSNICDPHYFSTFTFSLTCSHAGIIAPRIAVYFMKNK